MRGRKPKAIRKILRRKFHEFASSITDHEVRDLVKKNTIITGGSIASLLLGEDVADFDLYFRDFQTTERVARYFVNTFNVAHSGDASVVPIYNTRVAIQIQSAGAAGISMGSVDEDSPHEDPDGIEPFQPIFLSQNAITLSSQIQLIIRFFGDPDEIHKNYDFVHCTNYWTSWDDNLTLHQEALESLLSKELIYTGSLYPVCSVIRLRKFLSRGWVINAGQMLKMMLQISELDLLNLDVLEDQLTGVDSAYFMELLESVRDNDASKINSAYLSELIDRIF